MSVLCLAILLASVPATGPTNRLSPSAGTDRTPHAIEVTGCVSGAFLDDVDEGWTMLILSGDGQSKDSDPLVLSVSRDCLPRDKALELVGARISARGTLSRDAGYRRFFDRYLCVYRPGALTVLVPPGDPFDRPPLAITGGLSPSRLTRAGRVSIVGNVRAVWDKGQMLVKTDSDEYVRCTLADSAASASFSVGDRVKAVGIPETDLYHINLTQAIVRREPDNRATTDEPHLLTSDDILRGTDPNRPRGFNPCLHGSAVRMVGRVVDRQPDGFHISSEGHLVPVRFGSRTKAEAPPLGASVEVAGVCIVDCETWRPALPLPLIKGFYLVTRAPDDVRILAKPPWWTPGRLLAAIGVLCVALLGISVWNRFLDRLVMRKSNALVRERSARDLADMRADERMRLAADLHDSLSQNLSGIACLVTAADNELARNPSRTAHHLATLKRMLLSCRTELRRCLFDLRGDALDLPDFGAAILKTIRPVIGEAAADILFDVRRSHLPDSTAHAVLCIVRELSANAVRHGRATRIAVRGRIADRTLRFSVADDGAGFDPNAAAGPATGHFGLTGVRDRVKRLSGAFEIGRRESGGMIATVTIPLAQGEDS